MPRAMNKLIVFKKKMHGSTFTCDGNIKISFVKDRKTQNIVDRI